MKTIKQVMSEMQTRFPQTASAQEQLERIMAYPPIKAFIEEHSHQLSSQMIADSRSKLNEYMLEKEAINRGESGQNPGFTPELFINYNYIDVTYVPTEAYLSQEAQRKRDSLIDNRMMSRDVREAQLDEYDLSSEDRLELMEEVSDFLAQAKQDIKECRGIYLTGPFGVGKTYLLGALANSLVKLGIAVKMIHYPTFALEIKSLIGQNDQLNERINQTKKVPVLMIDDIGAESNSPWVRDEVLGVILEYRMKESLVTFFTSNFSIAELEIHLSSSRDSEEPLKAKRLMQRVRYLAKEYPLKGRNRRFNP